MALPTFDYGRRIDIVDALNELSTAADAAIEAGGGSSSYVLPVAADSVLGGGVARADVIDIVKQALQSAVLTDNGTLQFTLPD